MRRPVSVVAALIASAGLSAAAFGASVNYPLGNIVVGDFDNPYETALAAPGFNFTSVSFTTNWVAGSGGPWSNEAIWALTNGPLLSATEFYADPGPSPNGASSGASVNLNWATQYRAGFDPLPDLSAGPVWFLAVQTFDFSSANWNNSSLTLSDNVAPAPDAFVDLGVIGLQNVAFDIDTFGSDFDTELGLFNSVGGVAAINDDFAGLQSLISVPGLPAGDYFFNAGGFNTIYGSGGFEAIVDSFGSDGGNLIVNINGSEVYAGALAADSNQFFRFTIAVPAPGTLAVVGLAGIAGIRRRR